MSDEDRTAKRVGRGRPTKNQEILARMTVVHDPEAAGKMLFGDAPTSEDLIEGVGIEAKLAAISGKIASRLEMVSKRAKTDRDSEGDAQGSPGLVRPWLTDENPENVVSSCEQQFYANDRLISALLAHLVEHIIIGEDLRSIAGSARRRAFDELGDLPASMIDFSNRLMAAGVVSDDVRKMPKKRFADVVAAIKGVDVETVKSDVELVPMPISAIPDNSISSVDDKNGISRKVDGAVISGSDTVDEVRTEAPVDNGPAPEDRGAAAEDKSLSAEASERQIQANEFISEGDIEPVEIEPAEADQSDAPTTGEPAVSPDAAPASLGVLDGIDLTSIGYKIEVVRASTDDDLAALKMPMPNGKTLYDVSVSSGVENSLATNIMRLRERESVERFFRRWIDRTSTRLTPIQTRAWTLMLAEIPLLGKERHMGSEGWYDGVCIPVPGTNWVARIIAIDRSDDGLKESLIHNPTTLL